MKGGFGDAIHRFNANWGDIRLLDKKGNLVHTWFRIYDKDDPKLKEEWYNESADSIIRTILGVPEKHEKFVSSLYQSTDFSRDGEVVVLQTATIGRGVDIVLMGDYFVDKDMEPNGKYEAVMREGMEMLFSTEPFKSLRNRFNVYLIKIVAPNTYTPVYAGAEKNSEICFQYAESIEGVSRDDVTIISIANSSAMYGAYGESDLFYENSSVSYINGDEGVGSVLLHEVGHGLGKLADEYNIAYTAITEEEKQQMRDEMDEIYYSHGWGHNTSPTNDPEKVFWAHFLKDPRYAEEVGVYDIGNGLWRPSQRSLMNNNWDDLWYNAPSREALYKRIMQWSEGEGWTYDYETFVEFDTPAREAYKQAQIAESPKRKVQKQQMDITSPKIFEKVWYETGHNTKVGYSVKTR